MARADSGEADAPTREIRLLKIRTVGGQLVISVSG